MNQGDLCDEGENMTLRYLLECDYQQENLVITNQAEFDDTQCSNTIKMRTKYGNILYF